MTENAQEVAEHVLKMASKYDFKPDADSVRDSVEESANLLGISLAEQEIVDACDHILSET